MFQKNVFLPYRALTKIHLGATNDTLAKDEVVLFDGYTLKKGDKNHDLPSLQGAVKVGWLVLDSSEKTSSDYRPQSANVQMGEAVSKNEKRTLRTSTMVVHNDEQDVGELSAIRGSKALPIHDSKNSGNLKKVASTPSTDDGDGVVVGRFKTSAKAGPIEIGKDDRRVVQKLDSQSSVRVVKPTGDVNEAIVGEDLEDLLPDASSSSKPLPGLAGEGRGDESEMRAKAVFSSGSSEASSEGEVVGKVVSQEVVSESPAEIQKAKLAVVKAFIPDFEWDFAGPWMSRAKKAVDLFKDKPEHIKGVLAIEIPVVQKQIQKWLNK